MGKCTIFFQRLWKQGQGGERQIGGGAGFFIVVIVTRKIG
jgi:hypothetical protein